MAYDGIVNASAEFAGNALAQGEQYFGVQGTQVLLLTAGIAIYAIIVGSLYVKLSKKVLYELRLHDRLGRPKGTGSSILSAVSFALHYLVVFPLISFVWLLVISFSLYLLSRTLTLDAIFVIAISLIAAIRVCAYYREDIAVDVAKLLPLVLLGLVIVEPSTFTPALLRARLEALLSSFPSSLPFLGFVVGLEFFLRAALGIRRAAFPPKNEE
jgi:hypothetical protein